MSDLNWLPALVAFAAVVLIVGALALAWEGVRAYMRQKSAADALQRVREQGMMGSPGSQGDSLLREEEVSGVAQVLSRILNRVPQRADMRRRLEQAGVDWSPETFLLITLGSAAAFFVAVLLIADAVIAAAVAAAALFIPWFYVSRKRAKRAAAFEAAFPDSLDLLTRSLKAGQAFAAGLQVLSEEAEEPVRSEFRQVHEEVRFGFPVNESLESLADRVDLVDVRLFVTAILIQRESGGNLAEKLENLSRVIRARFKFRRQVRVHSAHGRMTGTIIGILPVIVAAGIYLLAPDYMGPMFTETLGRWMLLGGFISMMIGFFMIRRITQVQY